MRHLRIKQELRPLFRVGGRLFPVKCQLTSIS